MSDNLLRRRDVERRVGMRKSAIYAHMAEGKFPKPVHRGASVFWLESEIDAMIETMKHARNDDVSNDVSNDDNVFIENGYVTPFRRPD